MVGRIREGEADWDDNPDGVLADRPATRHPPLDFAGSGRRTGEANPDTEMTDGDIAAGCAPIQAPKLRNSGIQSPGAGMEVLLVLAGGLILGLPVLLLNGFPLTFDDTPGYFEPAFNLLRAAARPVWQAPPAAGVAGVVFSGNAFFLRPFPYAVFLLPFTADWTIWLIPVAQGAVAAYAVRRALAVTGLRLGPAVFLSILLGLALLTSLPAHAGMIMPDLFTGPLILLAFATAVGWRGRGRAGRLFDIATLSALTAVHLSHLAILGGLAAGFLVWSLVRLRSRGGPVRPGAVLLGLALPLGLAAGLLMVANLALTGKAVLSPSSPVFLLARLIGDGPARDYLAEACPDRGYLLCGTLDRLDREAPGYPASDYFLWHPDGARHVFGDSPRFLEEAAAIGRATIASRPLEVAGHLLANSARQLVRVGLDATLNDPVEPWTRQFFSRFGAPVYRAFLASPQFAGSLPLTMLNAVQAAALAVSLLALGWAGLHAREIGGRVWGLVATVGFGIVLNAAVTGGLSAVHDRYQNRVIWLVMLAAVAAILAVRRRTAATAPLPFSKPDPIEG